MTARCFALASLLLLSLTLAECSIYRTTISETIDEDREIECSKESMQHLGACWKCIQQGWQLMMIGESSQSRPHRCCHQLQGIREECRCMAIKAIARQRTHGWGEQEDHQKIRRAQDIASMCGIRHCSIHGGPY